MMLAYVAALYDEVSPALGQARFERIPGPRGILAYRSHGRQVVGGMGSPREDVLIVATGWGAEAARAGARWLIEELKPSAVVSIGYSGATRPGLNPGTLVIGERVVTIGESGSADTGSEIASDRGMASLAHSAAQGARVQSVAGMVATTPHVVSGSARKAAIGLAGPVLAIDLESWHTARAASDTALPFMAARVIVDTVIDDLPGFVARLRPGPRPPAAIPALRYVAVNPCRLRGVVRTGLAARTARQALARFIEAFSRRWQSSPAANPVVIGR